MTQLDSNVEEVTLQEIQLRKAFRSTQSFDQQVNSFFFFHFFFFLFHDICLIESSQWTSLLVSSCKDSKRGASKHLPLGRFSKRPISRAMPWHYLILARLSLLDFTIVFFYCYKLFFRSFLGTRCQNLCWSSTWPVISLRLYRNSIPTERWLIN